jgi:hypothetical protein
MELEHLDEWRLPNPDPDGIANHANSNGYDISNSYASNSNTYSGYANANTSYPNPNTSYPNPNTNSGNPNANSVSLSFGNALRRERNVLESGGDNHQ